MNPLGICFFVVVYLYSLTNFQESSCKCLHFDFSKKGICDSGIILWSVPNSNSGLELCCILTYICNYIYYIYTYKMIYILNQLFDKDKVYSTRMSQVLQG